MGVTRKKKYQEQEIFVNFGGYHGPLSGQNCVFWGSFLGQNVHFVRQVKPSGS